jgi:hypothetical protein
MLTDTMQQGKKNYLKGNGETSEKRKKPIYDLKKIMT